jgi:hypothetical protein
LGLAFGFGGIFLPIGLAIIRCGLLFVGLDLVSLFDEKARLLFIACFRRQAEAREEVVANQRSWPLS